MESSAIVRERGRQLDSAGDRHVGAGPAEAPPEPQPRTASDDERSAGGQITAVDRQFERGAGPAETVLNPATGQKLVDVPEASADQVERAVQAADKAFATWSRTTPAERAGMLLKLTDPDEAQKALLETLAHQTIRSVRGAEVGELRATV